MIVKPALTSKGLVSQNWTYGKVFLPIISGTTGSSSNRSIVYYFVSMPCLNREGELIFLGLHQMGKGYLIDIRVTFILVS